MNIQEAAKRAAIEHGGPNAALDPTTILTFFDIIKDLIAAIKACRESQAAQVEAIQRPGYFKTVRALRVIASKNKTDETTTVDLWRAVRNAARDLNDEEAAELLQANDKLDFS